MRSRDDIHAMWNRFGGLHQQLETGNMSHPDADTIKGIHTALFWALHPDSPDSVLMGHFDSEKLRPEKAGAPTATELAEDNNDDENGDTKISDESSFPEGKSEEDEKPSVPSQHKSPKK